MKRLSPYLIAFTLCTLALPSAPRAQELAVGLGPTTHAALEQEIAREINLARTQPAEYAAFLEKLRPFYSGREFRRPGQSALLTEEGVAALDEAVRHLRAARPAAALTVSGGMCAGAGLLVKDQTGSERTGHKGTDGSFCEQRVERFGAWQAPIGENLSYGTESARDRVITLLIDDGFASRGHRQRLLNPAFKVLGVACGGHQLGAVCVVTLAGGFTTKPSSATTPRPAATKAPAGKRKL
jgi:uncharacterized protein YkwD